MLSRHFYVLTRLAATIAISSSQRYWRSSGNYSCTLWFFRAPATKGCLWQGALSHESSNKKAYCAEGHDIMNVGAMHPLMSRFARSSKRLAIFRNTRKIASLTIFCASCDFLQFFVMLISSLFSCSWSLKTKPLAGFTKFAISPKSFRFTCHFGISLSAQLKHIYTQKPTQPIFK